MWTQKLPPKKTNYAQQYEKRCILWVGLFYNSPDCFPSSLSQAPPRPLGCVPERQTLLSGPIRCQVTCSVSRGYHLTIPSDVDQLPPGIVQAVENTKTIACTTEEVRALISGLQVSFAEKKVCPFSGQRKSHSLRRLSILQKRGRIGRTAFRVVFGLVP